MKKFLSILFVFSLLFMLTACSSSADPSQESSGQTTSPSSQQDSVSVEEICIMKATDNTQANTLLENANAHLSGQKQVFEGYGTDQMALLNNAVVGKKGNYVYYMCGADAQNWRTAFLSMI